MRPSRIASPISWHIIVLLAIIAPACGGCRVPLVDPTRNIFDGVPVLGSDRCCPPEAHPGAGCLLGKCDRRRYGPQPLHGDPLCAKLTSWHTGPDCDGRWLALERLIGRRRVGHCFPLLSALGFCRNCQPGTYLSPLTPCDEEATIRKAFLFFSLGDATTIDGLRIKNDDIVAFDGSEIARLLDGSDIGLSDLSIDAFAFLNDHQILISFSSEFTVDESHPLPGLTGTIDDSDILLFSANSLGEVTRGTFSVYLDGSDVGLTTDGEDIDAIAILDDGRLLISTVGLFEVGKVTGKDEDLMAFEPSSLGNETSGKWSRYFDGGDVTLGSQSSEDVDAATVDSNGHILLSSRGDFTAGDVQGTGSDVMVFIPEKIGKKTRGAFEPTLFFEGSVLQLNKNNVTGIDIPLFDHPDEWKLSAKHETL